MGHIFKLGTRYSQALGAAFLNAQGVEKPLVMGCYGIGTGRLLAAIVEEHHDERGIVWPPQIAPYQIHLVALGAGQVEVMETAERLYQELLGRGYEVLYDDREESAGVKFKDADLMGLPLRLTVSARSQRAGGVELKGRDKGEVKVLAPSALYPLLEDLSLALEAKR